MTHADLIELLVKSHCGILAASFGAFAYSFSNGFDAPLAGSTSVLTTLRQRIAGDLGDRLDPVFESPGSVPSPVLNTAGDTYVEHPVNPVGSEAYREAIRDFVEAFADSMSDYRSLLLARRSWSFWSRCLNWNILAMTVWQLIAISVALADKCTGWQLPEWACAMISIPTALGIIAFVVCIFCCIRSRHKINKLRLKYGEF